VLHLRGHGTSGGFLIGGVHIHRMVWVLVMLGIGWALVLDELALIINLRDVCWTPIGDESLVAVVLTIVALWWLSFRPIRTRT